MLYGLCDIVCARKSLCVGEFLCYTVCVIIVCVLGGFCVLYGLCDTVCAWKSLCVGGFLCAIQFVLS